MSEDTPGEAPAAVTPRLVFDNRSAAEDDDIPAFLRKQYGEVREPGDPKIEIVNPIAQIAESVDNVKTVEVPTQVETTSGAATGDEQMIDEGTGEGPANLDNMSVEELQRLEAEIERKKREKQEAEKKAVIAQIVEVVNTYKIPVEELVDALGGLKVKRKGVPAVQKYQDPETGATWSGRGKEPAWIKGKDRKKFLIVPTPQ